jgi:hypothetical protein
MRKKNLIIKIIFTIILLTILFIFIDYLDNLVKEQLEQYFLTDNDIYSFAANVFKAEIFIVVGIATILGVFYSNILDIMFFAPKIIKKKLILLLAISISISFLYIFMLFIILYSDIMQRYYYFSIVPLLLFLTIISIVLSKKIKNN